LNRTRGLVPCRLRKGEAPSQGVIGVGRAHH
jgi:hypothetical protein